MCRDAMTPNAEGRERFELCMQGRAVGSREVVVGCPQV